MTMNINKQWHNLPKSERVSFETFERALWKRHSDAVRNGDYEIIQFCAIRISMAREDYDYMREYPHNQSNIYNRLCNYKRAKAAFKAVARDAVVKSLLNDYHTNGKLENEACIAFKLLLPTLQ